MKKDNISLIEGNAKVGMLSFTFPIFLGQLFQQLYNIVDAIVVGNYVGENALAAVTAFSTAITTFVSQNIGAKKFDRVKEGIRFGALFSCVCAEIIGVSIFLFSPYLIQIFGDSKEVVEVGVQRANINALFYFLLSFSHCISGVLRGAGKSKIPMLTMLGCWCVIRVIYKNCYSFSA